MESRAYDGFVVIVRAVKQTAYARASLVIIRGQNEEVVTSIYSTREFPTDKDAEAYGFEIAEEWFRSNSPTTPRTNIG
jgi:hypothetical protein